GSIKFTKQSSVASTRNTLKMAQDAERAGMNTLGMLGHQSEQLNNVEGNLDLMKVQNKVADEKVAELKKLQ
uniref:Protein transport protein SEC9 n=1 Tax=Saccharomyces cerevisiae TaxID=4932 RepID=UPI00017545C4|nr:Chain C, Protein transport protein SEC9 [Saccharomyces cerevisiae]3B5N_G Chain G, Protein transport protein SEC9 [Saccharomyces cerevisiae]3B5N_K Chain K, Protein transport protein SEC9 [Saccharomyces cerevisiae]